VFGKTKAATDELIMDHNKDKYYNQVRPRSIISCAAHVVKAFKKLGCSLKNAVRGQRLAIVLYLPKHEKFSNKLDKIIGLEGTLLVNLVGGKLVRTACPGVSASTLSQEALQDEPAYAADFKFCAPTSSKLVECLTSRADGLQIIFGSPEARKTVSDVYAENVPSATSLRTGIQR
jgi:hypothetical protein